MLLGILLLLLSIRVGISCSYYFGVISFPAIKIGLITNLLLGPTILFKTLIDNKFTNRLFKLYLWHCGLLIVIMGICWFLFGFDIWDHIVRFSIHAILTIYLIGTAIILRKKIYQFIIEKANSLNEQEASIIFLALIAVCLGFVISLKTIYILGPLVFSVIFYITFIYFLLNNSQNKKKTIRKKIDETILESVKKKLTYIMEVEKIYQNTDINLDKLAGALEINRHLLSQLLNEHLYKNFYQYINEYRIEAACKMLVSKPYSIEHIGYEVGFRSKSAFFSVFKKMKGTTPYKYKMTHSTS